MIISKVAHQLGGDLPEGDAGYHSIAGRIEALVRDVRLLPRRILQKMRRTPVVTHAHRVHHVGALTEKRKARHAGM